MSQLRHLPREHVLLPLLLQRPGDGAGAEVGHVLVLREPVDGILKNLGIFPENRAVARQEELGVVVADARQRLDEAGQVRAVVGVDRADAAVLVDVVAAEEQVAELEAELPGVWPGVCQTFSLSLPTLISSPSLSMTSILQGGIGMSKFCAVMLA